MQRGGAKGMHLSRKSKMPCKIGTLEKNEGFGENPDISTLDPLKPPYGNFE